MKFTEDDLLSVNTIPVEQVAEALGMKVSRHLSLCPIHDDTHPSLNFSQKTNRWRCYACDAHGDNVELAKRVLGVSFVDAVKWLAQTFGRTLSVPTDRYFANIQPREIRPVKKEKPKPPLDLEYLEALVARPVLTPRAAHFLFDERHIQPEVVAALGISSIENSVLMGRCEDSGKFEGPALLFPYRDIEGKLITVQSRYLLKKEGKRDRFKFATGTFCRFFNLPILNQLEHNDALLITEGITDCLAALSFGFKAIAVPSASLFKVSEMEFLKKSIEGKQIRILMAPDDDSPGERLFHQVKDNFPLVKRLNLDGAKDFGEYYVRLYNTRTASTTPETLIN